MRPFVPPPRAALLGLLAGCGGALSGTWDGACDLLDADTVRTLELRLFLRDRGGDLSGSADISGHDYAYALSGTREGEAVDFRLEGSTEAGTSRAVLDFSGTVDAGAGRMEGEAGYQVELLGDTGVEGRSDPWTGTCALEAR